MKEGKISLKVHDLKILKLNEDQTTHEVIKKEIYDQTTLKKYNSFKKYLKWIITQPHLELKRNGQTCKGKFKIQSKITNNNNEEILLE